MISKNVMELEEVVPAQSAGELRQKLLAEGTEVVMSMLEQAKTGRGLRPSFHPESQAKVWDVISTILIKTTEKQKVDAKNTSDVLGLLKDGVITIAEAKELVAMFAIITGDDGGTESESGKRLIIEIAQGGAK